MQLDMETDSRFTLRHSRSLCFLILLLLPFAASAQTAYQQLIVRSPLPTSGNINGLKFENGKFFATVDGSSLLLSSDDGVTWEMHETGHTGGLSDVAYGNGVYIVTSAGSGPAYVSSDLENWTSIFSNNLPSNNDNVYFHNGLFYFGGAQWDDNPGIATTVDGTSFTDVATPGEAAINDIIFANNQFVTIGDDLEIMTSPDGVTWTVQTVNVAIPEDDLGEGLIHINYLNSMYVVGGKANTLLTSVDGVTWTLREFTEDSSWFFDSYYSGGTYYFPGRQGKLWTTTDWTTWTAIDTTASDDIYGIKNNGSVTLVGGRQGEILTTTNFSTWTNRKTGFQENMVGAAYGGSEGSEVFIITDDAGSVWKGTDGINWENTFTPGVEFNPQWLLYEDEKFVAMSSQGEYILSPTGNSGQWSLPTDGFEGFTRLNNVKYLDDLWWVVGDDGILRSSTNLTNWDSYDQAITDDFEDIAFGDGLYVAVGSNGIIYTSSDKTTWTARTSGTTNRFRGVAYGSGKFVAVGSSRTALTSVDGITWTDEGQSGQPWNPQELNLENGQFVITEISGRFYLSSDGLDWTEVRSPGSTNVRDTAASDSIMVAVGNNGVVMSGPVPPPYTLTVQVEGEGSVETSPVQSDYPPLSVVTLTAVGTADFAFSNWSGDASGNTNPLEVTMDESKTITANFVLALTGYELWRYLNFTSEERANDSLSGPTADFDDDGLTNNDEFEFGTNPKEKNGPHTLTVNIAGEGSIELNPAGGGPYTYATEVTVTATGTPEFAFTGWEGDASGSSNPLVVTMDADKTITANFSLDLDGFLLFRYSSFSAEERVDDSISGPQADYDLDGLTTLEEYLLGTDPKVFDLGRGVQFGVVEIGNQRYLTLTYQRSKDVTGISQTVEVGSDLATWQSGPALAQQYEVVDNGDGTESVTMRVMDPIGSRPTWFARMVFEES